MTKRLYLFDPNLKTAGGHYLGYAMRVAEAAEALGITPVLVAGAQMDPGQAAAKVLPALELNYWEEMCPAAGEDPHEHLSRSADRLAESLNRIHHDEALSSDDILFSHTSTWRRSWGWPDGAGAPVSRHAPFSCSAGISTSRVSMQPLGHVWALACFVRRWQTSMPALETTAFVC